MSSQPSVPLSLQKPLSPELDPTGMPTNRCGNVCWPAVALAFRCISLPGLAVLKLLAWAESGAARGKDAVDLALLLTTYAAVAGAALFDRHADLVAADDFDWESAGARVLGRDAAGIFGATVRARVQTVLATQLAAENSSLVVAMLGPDTPLLAAGSSNPVGRVRHLLGAFARGLRDAQLAV